MPEPVMTRDVLRWPEWKAFAARLGIDKRLLISQCVVMLDVGDTAKFSMQCAASDRGGEEDDDGPSVPRMGFHMQSDEADEGEAD